MPKSSGARTARTLTVRPGPKRAEKPGGTRQTEARRERPPGRRARALRAATGTPEPHRAALRAGGCVAGG